MIKIYCANCHWMKEYSEYSASEQVDYCPKCGSDRLKNVVKIKS